MRKSILSLIIIIFSIGVGQFIFVLSARSLIILTQYGTISGSRTAYLPPNLLNPNKYLLIVHARHAYIGSFTSGDIIFIHMDSGEEFHYHFVLSSSIYLSAPDSHIFNIPSGSYNIAWSADNALFKFELYLNGLFNSDGDPTFFIENMFTLTSVVVMLVVSICNIYLIYHFRYNIKNNKMKKEKSIEEADKKSTFNNIPKVANNLMEVQGNLIKTTSYVNKPRSNKCPKCGNILLKSDNNRCKVCGFNLI